LIGAQQERLRLIYESGHSPERKRADKEEAFRALQADYAELKQSWGGSGDYDAWFAQPLNNAALAAVATYTRWVPALRARLAEVGLERFYAETAELAELDIEQRAAELSRWPSQRTSTAR
jgi:predicted aminopeptidase